MLTSRNTRSNGHVGTGIGIEGRGGIRNRKSLLLLLLLLLAALVVGVLAGSDVLVQGGALATQSRAYAQVPVIDTPTPSPSPTCQAGWSLVSSPNEGSGNNQLNGVAAISANDVWA